MMIYCALELLLFSLSTLGIPTILPEKIVYITPVPKPSSPSISPGSRPSLARHIPP
jgi:hypothetical protein